MANPKHYVIYVPGIRDDMYRAQSLLIQCWRLQGVRPVMHAMPWEGDESYEAKMARLLARIDGYRKRGHSVSLVGASAGASAIINAYALRKDEIQSLAYICGKVGNLGSVSSWTFSRNPAFKTSLLELQQTVNGLNDADKRKMHSFYSPVDRVVPHADTIIDGVEESVLPPLGHLWSIVRTISLGSPKLLKTLR